MLAIIPFLGELKEKSDNKSFVLVILVTEMVHERNVR